MQGGPNRKLQGDTVATPSTNVLVPGCAGGGEMSRVGPSGETHRTARQGCKEAVNPQSALLATKDMTSDTAAGTRKYCYHLPTF